MARSIPEWEKAISELTPQDRARYLRALETLETWPLFKKEFDWTNVFIIGALIKIRCERFNETEEAAPLAEALQKSLDEAHKTIANLQNQVNELYKRVQP